MKGLTAVVIGSTGMVGNYVVDALINDPAFETVRLLVRKPLEARHSKVQIVVTDFSDSARFSSDLGQGDCIFCCIGTTMSKVGGDKGAYRKIDYDIPVDAARFGLAAGFTKYLLVSSVGANVNSNTFYLRLKGEVEDSIKNIHYPATHIFRPSFLLGDRKEFRLGEKVVSALMGLFAVFFAGSLRKYKSIDGRVVAKAMVDAAKSDTRGFKVYEYGDMAVMGRR